MTSDLDIWQVGSTWHYVGQSSRPRETNAAKVVGATSGEGFLVFVV